MAFDPDAYLKTKTAERSSAPTGFDPDAYLATKTSAPKSDAPTTAIRKGLSGATFGWSDEGAGSAEAAGRAIGVEGFASRPISEMTFAEGGPTLDRAKLNEAYLKGRNKERGDLKQDEVDRPTLSKVSEFTGGLLSPANKALAGLSMAKGGAAVGAIAGAGNSEADTLGGVAADTAIGAGSGLVIGKALGKTGEMAAKSYARAKPVVGQKLKDLAETQAFKATGAMLKDFRTANDRKQVNETGRYLLDKGIVALGDTVEDVATKSEASRLAAGERLDTLYSTARKQFSEVLDKVGFDPKRDKEEIIAAATRELGDAEGGPAAIQRLTKYLDEVAARHGDEPDEVAQKKFREAVEKWKPEFKRYLKDEKQYTSQMGKAADDGVQSSLPGWTDDLQRTGEQTRKIEVNGADRSQANLGPEPQYQQQSFLPDLPTAETATSRIYGREGQPSFDGFKQDAVDEMGTRLGQNLLPGEQQAFLNQNTAEQIALFGKQSEMAGLEAVPRAYREVRVPGVIQREGQQVMPLKPSIPNRPVRPQEIRNPMDPRRTNEIKTAIDDTINYSRNPLSKEPNAEVAFGAARKVISQKVDDAIETLGGSAMKAELKAANKEYGMSAQAARIAKDRGNRESANQMFSLTDKIAGSAGAVAGATLAGPAGLAMAVATGVGSRMVRKYRTTTMAVMLDRASKKLLQENVMKEVATKNPKMFQAAVLDMMAKLEQRGAFSDLPVKAADTNELDEDTSRSSNYREGN